MAAEAGSGRLTWALGDVGFDVVVTEIVTIMIIVTVITIHSEPGANLAPGLGIWDSRRVQSFRLTHA